MQTVDVSYEIERPIKEKQELDPEIKPFVEFLNTNGFKTFTSCQGGEGHAFQKPTVGILFEGDYFEFKKKLIEFLLPHVRGFTLNLKNCYGTKHNVHWEFLYIEFPDLTHIRIKS